LPLTLILHSFLTVMYILYIVLQEKSSENGRFY
jgi:hypothetical protein